jgi:hypothetical protein
MNANALKLVNTPKNRFLPKTKDKRIFSPDIQTNYILKNI